MIPENTKKLGFGTMRLPLTDPEDTAAIDVDRFCEMVDHFLAVPYDMFWLAEEDRDIWPWKLPQERRMNTLSEAERQSVMTAVNEYYRHRKDPVIFLTKELEDRSLELAEMIRNKQISGPMWIARRKAAALLKKEFPGLPDKFYRYQIIDSLTGARWYR